MSAKEAPSQRYASRQVLLGLVEEAYDRLLERLGILTLVFRQMLHTNERVDVHLIQQDANGP
jgi:hypothetical protein